MSLHSCQARSKVSCARKCATSDLSTGGESHCRSREPGISPQICAPLDYMRTKYPEPQTAPGFQVGEKIGCVGQELCARDLCRYFQVGIALIPGRAGKRFEGLAGGTLQGTPSQSAPGTHFLPNATNPRVRSLCKPVGKLNELLRDLAQLLKLLSFEGAKTLSKWSIGLLAELCQGIPSPRTCVGCLLEIVGRRQRIKCRQGVDK